jgi:hypothetical protein
MPIDMTTIVIGEAVLFLVLGVFGIVAGIFLILLKNWARIAFLVFGGVVAAMAGFGVLGGLVLMVSTWGAPMPNFGAEMPPAFMTFVYGFIVVTYLFLGGLGVWWLRYLTRHPVRVAFLGEAGAALPRRGPLSVTIIAWVMLVSGCLWPLVFVLTYPIMLFGVLLQGWEARLAIALLGIVTLIAGAGLLRWRAGAYPLAMGLLIVGGLNVLSYFVIPGAFTRFQEALTALFPQTSGMNAFVPSAYLKFAVAMGFVYVGVPLYFLIVNRRAFLDACIAKD